MRKWTIVLLGLALFTMLLWMTTRGETAVPEQAAREQAEDIVEAEPPSLARDLTGAAREKIAAAEEESVEPPVKDGIVVEVVDGESGEPVPHAEVLYLESGALPSRARGSVQQSLGSLFESARRFGRQFRTGADGTTAVPGGPSPGVGGSATVFGASDDMRGFADLGEAVDGRLRLFIAAPSSIRVSVVDAQGQPCPGVPVALVSRQRDRNWRPALQREAPEPDAVVVFDLVPGFFDQAPPETLWAVALWVPAKELVHRRFEWQSLPGTTIELVLPPVGSVEVHALDAGGQKMHGAGEVMLHLEGEDRPAELRASRFGPQELRDGVARYAWVALGLQLRATVDVFRDSRDLRATGPGPSFPGEAAVLQARHEADASFLVVRVLDEDGTPLGDTPLCTSVQRGTGKSFLNVVSDPEGLIRVQLTEGLAGHMLAVWRSRPGRRFDMMACGRLATSEEPYPAGESFLGDLRLEAAPLLAEGLVVDPAGQPVADVEISARGRVPDPDRPGRTRSLLMHESNVESDADGRFEIRGWIESASMLSLTPVKTGYVREGATEVAPGTTGVELNLHRGGGIVATLAEDSLGLLEGNLLASLVSPQGSTTARSFRNLGRHPSRGNRLIWEEVEPGTYGMVLRLPTEEDPLWRIDGIRVEAGRITRDPRVQDIDLTGLARDVQITILDPSGEPVEGAEIGQSKGEQWIRTRTDSRGLATVAVPRWGAEVQVSAVGYRAVKQVVAEDRTFRLLPGFAVRVEVSGIPSDIREDAHVFVRFLRTDLDGPGVRVSPGEPVSLPGAGRYEIGWALRISTGARFGVTAVFRDVPATVPPAAIEVRDTAEVQVLEILFTEEVEAEARKLIREARGGL